MKKYWRTLLTGFVIIFILAGVSWTISILQDPQTLPFRQIKIVADENHIDINTLKKAVLTNLQGGFFSLRANQLRQALLTIPWVYDVSLQRIWPNTLLISVHEQQVIARWNTDELMNTQGALFKPPYNTIPQNLPQLSGPQNTQLELLQRYLQFRALLTNLNLQITALTMNPRHALQLTLNNQLQLLLGREDINQRITHFVDLYPQIIAPQKTNINSIDLRYPNGAAISWKARPTS